MICPFGGFVLMTGRSAPAFAAHAQAAVPLAVAVAASYLWLGLRYWFRTPIIGCALSAALFLASWIRLVAGAQ